MDEYRSGKFVWFLIAVGLAGVGFNWWKTFNPSPPRQPPEGNARYATVVAYALLICILCLIPLWPRLRRK